MTQAPGVREMAIKELKADAAVLVLQYAGETRTLAQELMIKPYDAFGIRIGQVEPGRINMALIPRD